MTANRYVRAQPSSQSYLLRLQGLLRPVRTENVGAWRDTDTLETAENGAASVTVVAEGPSMEMAASERVVVGQSTPLQH